MNENYATIDLVEPSGPYTPLYGTLKFWSSKVVFFVYATG